MAAVLAFLMPLAAVTLPAAPAYAIGTIVEVTANGQTLQQVIDSRSTWAPGDSIRIASGVTLTVDGPTVMPSGVGIHVGRVGMTTAGAGLVGSPGLSQPSVTFSGCIKPTDPSVPSPPGTIGAPIYMYGGTQAAPSTVSNLHIIDNSDAGFASPSCPVPGATRTTIATTGALVNPQNYFNVITDNTIEATVQEFAVNSNQAANVSITDNVIQNYNRFALSMYLSGNGGATMTLTGNTFRNDLTVGLDYVFLKPGQGSTISDNLWESSTTAPAMQFFDTLGTNFYQPIREEYARAIVANSHSQLGADPASDPIFVRDYSGYTNPAGPSADGSTFIDYPFLYTYRNPDDSLIEARYTVPGTTELPVIDPVVTPPPGTYIVTSATDPGKGTWQVTAASSPSDQALIGTYWDDTALIPAVNGNLTFGLQLGNLPPVQHTVTFAPNGGSGTMSPQTSSAPTALTRNAFTRPGFTFLGWNTAPDGTGTPYPDGATYSFAADLTLYAQWQPTSPPPTTAPPTTAPSGTHPPTTPTAGPPTAGGGGAGLAATGAPVVGVVLAATALLLAGAWLVSAGARRRPGRTR